MTDYALAVLQKKKKQGKLLTLILLLLGLAVTVIYFFGNPPEWFAYLAPFNVPSMAFQHWFHPALVYVPLAVLALAGWFLIHLGRLFGRELIIGCMSFYLVSNLVLIPFYSLIVSSSWQISYLGRLMSLSIAGIVYPVLVLVALHRWNPRRK